MRGGGGTVGETVRRGVRVKTEKCLGLRGGFGNVKRDTFRASWERTEIGRSEGRRKCALTGRYRTASSAV